MVGKGADGVSPEFAFHTVGRSRFGCLVSVLPGG